MSCEMRLTSRCTREAHVADRIVLPPSPFNTVLHQPSVKGIEAGGDGRAHGAEGVEALGARVHFSEQASRLRMSATVTSLEQV